MLKSKEFYEIMAQFEKDLGFTNYDKEDEELWYRKIYYCNGRVNELFIVYLLSYSYAKSCQMT